MSQSYPYWPNGGRPGGGGVILSPGTVLLWTTSTAPNGWVICNGQALNRSTYSNLFNAIGTTFGSGDGSTTFNVPTMNDRFPLGVGTNALGATGGSTTYTMTTNDMPAHSHTITDNGHTHADNGHTHDYLAITSRVYQGIGGATNWLANPETTQATGTNTSITITPSVTGIVINNAGGGQPFPIMNP